MLAASAAFQAQESSDANKPKLAAWLYFGNYALLQTAAASGSLSTNYPAAGAINGDRTEINIGPASGADNGVGLASWKSDGVPDTAPADSVWWSVTWPTAKYVNYLKLYQRAGHGLTEYWVDLYMDLGDGYQWYAVAHRVAGGLLPWSTALYVPRALPFSSPIGLAGETYCSHSQLLRARMKVILKDRALRSIF